MKGRTRFGLLGACCALLASAAPALADTRYASPGGDASNTACPLSDPCDIQTAVEHASVVDGDVVMVLGGDHTLPPAEWVTVLDDITIQGDTTGPRPRLISSGSFALHLADGIEVVVRDLYVESTDSPGEVVNADGGGKLLERVEVVARGDTSIALFATIRASGGPTVRDSVLRNVAAAGGNALATAGTGAPGEIALRNVTAVSTGPSADGIFISSVFGSPQQVSLRNVIATGPDNDIELLDAAGPGDDIQVDLSYSNFGEAVDDPSPETVLTLGPGNQVGMPPLFVNAAAGDFHQLPGSPTVDAGSPDGLTGALDLDGEPRIMGGRIDIGADELFVALGLTLSGRLRVKVRRQVSFFARCSDACAFTARPRLRVPRKRGFRTFRLRPVNASLAAGQRRKITVRIGPRALRALRRAMKRPRARRRARLVVSGRATAPGGRVATRARVIRFRR